MLDFVYYSNMCPHSQAVVQYVVKNGLTERLNFICVDKRRRDDNNNNWYVVLEDGGRKVMIPPNIHSVPSLLLTKENYRVVAGAPDILGHLEKAGGVAERKDAATNSLAYYSTGAGAGAAAMQSGNGEPLGVGVGGGSGGMNIVSEQFTAYDMSPEELSAKGSGQRRSMHNYYPATHDIHSNKIETPVDTYTPNKLAANVTVDVIEQRRNSEIPKEVFPNFNA